MPNDPAVAAPAAAATPAPASAPAAAVVAPAAVAAPAAAVAAPAAVAAVAVPDAAAVAAQAAAAKAAVVAEAKALHESEFKAALTAAEKTQREGWVNAAKTDPEFGGAKFAESLVTANKTLDAVSTPAFVTALKASGFANHPEMIRMLLKFHSMVGEEKLLASGAGAGQGQKSAAQVLYPNQGKK